MGKELRSKGNKGAVVRGGDNEYKKIILALQDLDLIKQIKIVIAFSESLNKKLEITRYINFEERKDEIDEEIIEFVASLKNINLLVFFAELLRGNKKIYDVIIDNIIKVIDEVFFWETAAIIEIASKLNDDRVTKVFVEMILRKRKGREERRGCLFLGKDVLNFMMLVPNSPKKLLLEYAYDIKQPSENEINVLVRLLISEEQKLQELNRKFELVKKMKGKSINRPRVKNFKKSKKYTKKR